MKYLSDYMEDQQTALFNETGAFFAFSGKQYEEKAKPGVKYCSVGAGMICPKENAKRLVNGLKEIYKSSIQKDIEENDIEAIVIRELGNHECWYVGSPADAIDKLADYPVSKEEIKRIFREN